MPYVWLTADELIELADGIIRADGTAACPYFGRGHLYTGPYPEIYEKGNILDYRMGNHARAKFLAPIFGALLIDDMNVSTKLVDNVDGKGIGVYQYLATATPLDPNLAKDESDRVMRHVSGRFIDGLWGELTTSVIGADRSRIFFDTEYAHMADEAYYLVAGLGKSKEIEIVNDGSIMEIRKLYKRNAIELGHRVISVSEIDKLDRTAWQLMRADVMRHCLDVEEFYRIDRSKMWRKCIKEILGAQVGFNELIELDRKLNNDDRAKRRTPDYRFGPPERLSDKERRLFLFVVTTVARKARVA